MDDIASHDPVVVAQRLCKRPGCGHHRHNHGNGGCSVVRVFGPASDHKTIISKADGSTPEADMHPGRTVERCGCAGFLS